VGSSNLDPLSLLLAREANVVVEDPVFAADLGERLMQAITEDGRAIDPAEYAGRPLIQRMLGWIAWGIMRAILAVTGNRY
jgi:cardiolipin synthase